MTRTAFLLKRLGRDRIGATIVEFAMILPALVVMLLGIFELGYRSYAASVIQGALHEAARMATVGGVTMDEIDALVNQRLSKFAEMGTVETGTTSYYDFAGVAQPERITSDTSPLLVYNEGDCFEDANGNGSYDTDRGDVGSTGNSEDIVRYEVTVTFPRIVPVGQWLGWSDEQIIHDETLLRNQPWAGRSITLTEVCT